MTASTARPLAHRHLVTVAHRWPTLVGLVAAAGAVLTGVDGDAVASTVALAVSCYLAAAAFGRPWMAWAWIPVTVVIVAAGRLLDIPAPVLAAVVGLALIVTGLLRHATRPALTRQTAGFVGYGACTLVALALAPSAGLVVAALALIGHGVWDVWHLRRHRDEVSPSLAEACVALDVPLGVAALVLAFL